MAILPVGIVPGRCWRRYKILLAGASTSTKVLPAGTGAGVSRHLLELQRQRVLSYSTGADTSIKSYPRVQISMKFSSQTLCRGRILLHPHLTQPNVIPMPRLVVENIQSASFWFPFGGPNSEASTHK